MVPDRSSLRHRSHPPAGGHRLAPGPHREGTSTRRRRPRGSLLFRPVSCNPRTAHTTRQAVRRRLLARARQRSRDERHLFRIERGSLESFLNPPLTEEERGIAAIEGAIRGVCLGIDYTARCTISSTPLSAANLQLD